LTQPEWMAPDSLEEALALRAERGDELTVLAGGTFLGILMNQGLLAPGALLSLGRVDELKRIDVVDGELRLGAMVSHRRVEREVTGWPVLARAFGLVASPRVRNQATVGGVLADADYASDPPAMLAALDARAILRSPRGDRAVAIGELILGYYDTCIEADELLVEVRVPAEPERATYRKFRSRSAEDRPCAAVAAVNGDRLRVVVGAVAETPQEFPCEGGPDEIAAAYAERIEPLSDSRGSARYRRRVIAAEVKRAVEDVWTRA
jgi:aerobic carbon-monoxide dehydrogenase medium subunit